MRYGLPRLLPALCLCSVPALLRAGASRAADAPDVRQALALLSVVAGESREGVVHGKVVQPLEYEEAKRFLDEVPARWSTESSPDPSAPEPVEERLGLGAPPSGPKR